ncbi:MAG: calcium-binding protein, partial [Methylophilus sp.]|nr:calcium-binding protein [Methylophilus sp.]
RLTTGTYTLNPTSDIENVILAGVSAINATGNASNNSLTGNVAANILNGNGGTDTLTGWDGNDTYIIDGDDTVIETNALAAGGIDLVKSSVNYTLTSNVENLTLTDNINANGGTANINGTGNALNNIITGNAGDNVLDGKEGNDTLIGGDGNDTLTGGAGIDILNGGAGHDTYVFNTNLNAITNKDTIQGFNVVDDQILLDFSIFNAIGPNLDVIEFRSGAGYITAATADQRIIFNTSTGALYYDADGLGGVTATQFATLTGTVGALTNNSFSLGLNFNITGTDQADTLNGTIGNDSIIGLAGNDIINGGTGADIMYGDLGEDTFYVDNVDDIVLEDYFYFNESNGYYYENGHYELGYVGGHPNNANIIYSSVTYTADFGIGNLTLTGSDNINGYGSNLKINIITGNDGNNILDGGVITNPELTTNEYHSPLSPYIFFIDNGGNDTLIGGKGDDTYIIRGGETVIENSGEGIDTYVLSYNTSIPTAFLIDPNSEIENFILANDNVLHDYISGTNKDNLIIANNIANNIYGLAGNDELKGLGGDDKLYGMSGNDILWGGAGNDTLIGEFGADTFVWSLADKGTNALPSLDKVTDFNLADGDILDLHDLLVNESSTNILNFLDITTSTTAGITNTEIRISNTGGFAGGTFAAAAENQHITLAGVNLLTGTNEADLLTTLITQNKLIIDV